jgi:hypothetical protein
MVIVTITIQQKHRAWYVMSYRVELADGTIPDIPPPPKRMFISPKAASNYIGRTILSRLKLIRSTATGTDIVCHVTVQPPIENPKVVE